MEYWNANVQGIRQVFDIKRYFIIHETRANSAECEPDLASLIIS